MGLQPKIPKKEFKTKTCGRCHKTASTEDFAVSHSIFYPDHLLPICNSCANDYLAAHNYEWEAIDKLCQWADIPFIVREWTRLCELNGEEHTWPVYARVFQDECYKSLGWGAYNAQYNKLKEVGLIEMELPLIHEEHMKNLRKKWGGNYDDDELFYLEDLLQGLKTTQNVNGALQIDQAKKVCKLSLEIDNKIKAGDKDVEKFLSSYDKLVKTAEFTPRNAKNAVDFDSAAEIVFWLEKRGKQHKFYDNVTRDVIDETMKNIQNYNRKLYINEGDLGEEITERIRMLQIADQHLSGAAIDNENVYGLTDEFDEEAYDNEGYTFEGDKDDFVIYEDGEVVNGRTD